MTTEIKRERFTKIEAEALVGKTFEMLVNLNAFPEVPTGTRGKVVEIDDSWGDGPYAVIQWQLPPHGKPLREWFTKDEMRRFMREIPYETFFTLGNCVACGHPDYDHNVDTGACESCMCELYQDPGNSAGSE